MRKRNQFQLEWHIRRQIWMKWSEAHLSSFILIHLYCFLISLNTLVFLSHNDSYIYIFLLDTLIHLSCLLICFYQRSYSEIINNSYYLIFFRCDPSHSASLHFIHIWSLQCPSIWNWFLFLNLIDFLSIMFWMFSHSFYGLLNFYTSFNFSVLFEGGDTF